MMRHFAFLIACVTLGLFATASSEPNRSGAPTSGNEDPQPDTLAGGAFRGGPPPWMDPSLPPPAPTPLGEFQPFGARGTDGKHTRIHFDDLANYLYSLPETIPSDNGAIDDGGRIPTEVKEFGGRTVVVDGYMLPLNVERGKTTRFLLLRNTLACCYGTPPEPNEWILVDAPGGVAPLMDILVDIYGELVVEERWESGYLLGLYHLRADRMAIVRQSRR